MSELKDWASLLKKEWDERAGSPCRDFYVASHKGWDDAQAWEAQANVDVDLVLSLYDAEALRRSKVLEIGCGVGRLARGILQRAASYTGFDISGPMVEEARRRCEELRDARFFESDGGGIPQDAKDRRYDLIFALAVFIHCPEVVIRSLITEALLLLAPGGRFQFQLLADTDDPSGIDAPQETTQAMVENAAIAENLPEIDMSLVRDRHYEGHRFRYEEARSFLEPLSSASLRLFRFDPHFIYALLQT